MLIGATARKSRLADFSYDISLLVQRFPAAKEEIHLPKPPRSELPPFPFQHLWYLPGFSMSPFSEKKIFFFPCLFLEA